MRRLASWTQFARELRAEGFYERFPAKAQVERVARLHRELADSGVACSRLSGTAHRLREGAHHR
jgi:hypothetical protein